MNPSRLNTLIAAITRARVGIVGDFCVDSYHIIDMAASEPSLETGIATHPVREQRHTLGGAGNVTANLHAMGVRSLSAFAVIGPDMIGAGLTRLLASLGVNARGVICQPRNWQTHSYLKPIVNGSETNRCDFGVFNKVSPATTRALLAALDAAMSRLDALIINQQFGNGLHSPAFQSALEALLKKHRNVTALADCRNLRDAYPSAIRKLNDHEAARLCGLARGPREPVPRAIALAAGARLHAARKLPVFITRGCDGCLVVDKSGAHEIPAVRITGPVDPVGAGDSMVAAIAACLAVGATPSEAAAFGNLVAGVTVQKLRQTGTASPAEIRAIAKSSARASRVAPA